MRATVARTSAAGGRGGMGVGTGVAAAASPCGVGVGVIAAGDSAEVFCAAGVGDVADASGAGFEFVHAPSANASASIARLFGRLLIFFRRVLIKLQKRLPDSKGR